MRPRIAMFKLLGALAIAGALSTSLLAEDRQLVNAWDVRDEIKLAPGVDPASVKEYFPSFYDYLDTVLFHPTAGYYSSGRVNFSSDYQTFPIALYPSFGQMITEHMFQMWDGMRKAGTLGPERSSPSPSSAPATAPWRNRCSSISISRRREHRSALEGIPRADGVRLLRSLPRAERQAAQAQ
jgi:hypothetical protein